MTHRPPPFGHYACHQILAEGATGAVLRATHLPTRRIVALKVVTPRVLSEHSEHFDLQRIVDGFQNEARMMASVEHPHVVTLYDAGRSGACPYLAMRLYAGDLEHLVTRDGTLSYDRLLRILVGAARGLSAIHAAGIVHRDLKPANILLDASGEPAIGDFGIAQPLGSAADEVHGTPGYLAPEVIRGGPATVASDWYALGATLWCASTGQPLFSGRTVMETMAAISSSIGPPSAPSGRNDLPGPYVRVLQALLHPDPEQRLAVDADVVEAAERLWAHRQRQRTIKQGVTAVFQRLGLAG